jgi:hypothetical protein
MAVSHGSFSPLPGTDRRLVREREVTWHIGRGMEKKMSQEKTPTGEDFERKLIRLRTRIDLLPPEQRPHLDELADAISREHRHLEDRKLSNHDSQ